MTPKEHPKELKEFLGNLNKEHNSVYKERGLELNLFWFDKDHCQTSYENEVLDRQLSPEYRE